MAARKPALLSVRLRSTVCRSCDYACPIIRLAVCTHCKARYDWEGYLDLWEVYDDVEICPNCDKPQPHSTLKLICPKDLPTGATTTKTKPKRKKVLLVNSRGLPLKRKDSHAHP